MRYDPPCCRGSSVRGWPFPAAEPRAARGSCPRNSPAQTEPLYRHCFANPPRNYPRDADKRCSSGLNSLPRRQLLLTPPSAPNPPKKTALNQEISKGGGGCASASIAALPEAFHSRSQPHLADAATVCTATPCVVMFSCLPVAGRRQKWYTRGSFYAAKNAG